MNNRITILCLIMNLLLYTETKAERDKRILSKTYIESQAKWVADRSRIKVAYKCRQLGFTWCTADNMVDETSKANAPYDVWVTSRSEAQAKAFIKDCQYWAKIRNVVATDMGEVILDKKKGYQACKLEFATERAIYSLSSNPDAIAGNHGHFFADEFALSKQQREVYAIGQPATMRGGCMTYVSTPRGTNSFMHTELVKPALDPDPSKNKKKISLHLVTIQQAVQEGLWVKIRSKLPKEDDRKEFTDDDFLQALRDECPDEESWLQEYCCTPGDDATALLPWEDMVACGETWEELRARDLPRDAPRFVGYDVARKKDLSVITVLCQVSGIMVVEKVIVLKKMKFSDQRGVLFGILEDPNVQMCAIDAGGLGMDTAEQTAENFPGKVMQVMFTMQTKLAMAGPLKQRFEDRSIRIPCGQDLEERLYTADLRSVKKEVTPSQNIIITSEAGATDGHADRFWSLALANFAAHGKPTNGGGIIITPGDPRFAIPGLGWGEIETRESSPFGRFS